MMTHLKKHHYIPQFYLAGFTPTGSREDKVYVLDLQTGRQRPSSPSETGFENYFYKLEFEGDQAFSLEQVLSKIEGEVSIILRATEETGNMPIGDDYLKLMIFLAIMAVRVPGWLSRVDNFFEQISKKMMRLVVAKKERWESTVARMKADGIDVGDAKWEKMKASVEGDEFNVKMNQNYRMFLMMNSLYALTDILANRKWTVWTAPAGSKGFICSDRPLSCGWLVPPPIKRLSPAPGMPNTFMMFPLSKRRVIHGIFEAQLPPKLIDPISVGQVNIYTALFAHRFVYSTGPDFEVTLPDMKLAGKTELREYWKTVHESGNQHNPTQSDSGNSQNIKSEPPP